MQSKQQSKLTSSKVGGGKDSVYLGVSGMKGLFDIVDHDKLAQTLGNEIRHTTHPVSPKQLSSNRELNTFQLAQNRERIMTPTDKHHKRNIFSNDKTMSVNPRMSNISSNEINQGKRSHRSRVKERRDRPQFFSSSFIRQNLAASDVVSSPVSSPNYQSRFAKTQNVFFYKRKPK